MTREAPVPVAVIGMACRLPGGIDSPELLWEALLRGEDLVTDVPRDRWDADEYYHPEPGVPGRTASKWGAFLDDVAGFDAEFFGIDEQAATALDPQHRLLLETSWEAVEHAGLTPASLTESPTGVFVGLSHFDYQLVNADSDAMAGPYGFEGNTLGMASGRISRALGLRGPALTLDTACSSGLTAVHMACRSLHDGESALALAGGAFIMLEPRKFVAGTAQSYLSPTGRCHAFDAEADGYVTGEAVAVVLLKRLPDALRDGDRVLAVIRATAANHDGGSGDFPTPSQTAQTALYRAALDVAGVEAHTIGLIEAHGPGTPDGDPIEYASLAEVYGTGAPCALGSVKTNVGHTQSASGILGLMKAVLAVRHGAIPQNLHFTRLPDTVAGIQTNLFVPQSTSAWPETDGLPRRAAVSAYGTSGTNVHAIVEQAPGPTRGYSDENATPARDSAADQAPLVFPLSSTSDEQLARTADRLAAWVDAHDDVALPDLGYTLARRRAHRPVRTAVLARDRSELREALRGVAEGRFRRCRSVGDGVRGPVWVFSGESSQFAALGADLLRSDPVFAATVAEIEPLIAAEAGFSVTDALQRPLDVTGFDRVQPVVFTIGVAAAAALTAGGARPGAVIGHSMGEISAAVVAGALSLEDGVRVVCRSSRLMAGVAGAGAMASVELPAKQVLSELTMRSIKDVVIAVVSAPESTVISGAAERVHEMVAQWRERGVEARTIEVEVAANSPQLDRILKELTGLLGAVDPRTPTVPFYSATGFDPREEPFCDARYWVQALRRTVRFAAAVRAAVEDGFRVFVELPFGRSLADAVEQTAANLDVSVATPAGVGEEVARQGLADVVAEVHCAGAHVDFGVLYPGGRLVDAPLPRWTHRRLWLSDETGESRTPTGYSVAAHPLLGPHVRLQREPEQYVWQAEVGTATHRWLAEHRIRDVAVLPGAAYCEMALAAGAVALGPAEVCDLVFVQALPLDEHTALGVSTSSAGADAVDFVVETNQNGEHARQATAVLRAMQDGAPEGYELAELLRAHPQVTAGDEVRARLDRLGVQYGPAFAGLGDLHISTSATGSVLAELALPGGLRGEQSAYRVHPALLDACFQSVAASPHVQALGEDVLGMPLGVQRLRVHGAPRHAQYCYTRVTRVDSSGVEADLDVLDGDGAVLISVQGLSFGAGSSDSAHRDRVLAERLLTVEWQQSRPPEPEADVAGAWLLIGADDTAAVPTAALADALLRHGAECTSVFWTCGTDEAANTEHLRSRLRDRQFAGVVVMTGTTTAAPQEDCTVQGLRQAQHLLRIAREVTAIDGRLPRLAVVTHGAQTVLPGDVPDLAFGALRGLVRVLGAEYPHLRTTLIDVDGAAEAASLARQLLSDSDEDETAWRDAVWYTARLRAAPLRPDERQVTVANHDSDGMRLQIRTPGDLETLELVTCDRTSPGPGEIEVAVAASGINFADVLVAMGRFPNVDGEMPELGMDFAGVVTAVGPDVSDHQVGDRVGGFSPAGCWGTFVTCDARLAVPLPPGLSDHQAVAVATATATAWYGLHDLARIGPTDRVLIHSATGGVGQAAIAIARAAGAAIYATAGSEERRDLLRSMGIEHVYDSRSIEFAAQIREDTDGYGVDVVLNSLAGPAQRAGVELLAIGGRFIEIGKRDVYGNSRLDLFPFRNNLSFFYVDLALMALSQPHRAGALLRTVYRMVADGQLPPARYTDYRLADAAVALREMGAAQHTGKLVLDVPRTGQSDAVTPPAQAQVFRTDGAYIVTDGLSDLGLFMAEKIVDAGCGRIVLASPTQPTLKALETIELIRVMGGDVVVHCGDIAQPDTAREVVAVATSTGLPVRGVLHAATTTADAPVPKLADESIAQAWAPRVFGAWNLHTATAGQPLDWFCCFSSTDALLGAPGRGAGAAADSWLDSFARWRRATGRPATVIAWGTWRPLGRTRGAVGGADADISPDEGAYAFEMLLRHDRTYSGYASVTGSASLGGVARRSPFAEAFRTVGPGDAGAGKLLAVLGDLPVQEWPTRLRRLISDQISLVLRRSIDPDRPLAEYGVDSLAALELRTRLEAETGIRLAAGDLAVGTIRGLAELLCGRLAPEQEDHESRL